MSHKKYEGRITMKKEEERRRHKANQLETTYKKINRIKKNQDILTNSNNSSEIIRNYTN